MKTSDTSNASKADFLEELESFQEFLTGQHALDTVVLELKAPEAFADAMIICGATSRRHAQGLADGIMKLCRENSWEFLGMEGYENAEWILLDCNNIVVHIFQEETRQLYRLEDLWSGKLRPPKEGLN